MYPDFSLFLAFIERTEQSRYKWLVQYNRHSIRSHFWTGSDARLLDIVTTVKNASVEDVPPTSSAEVIRTLQEKITALELQPLSSSKRPPFSQIMGKP
jgi:hypothetical protein